MLSIAKKRQSPKRTSKRRARKYDPVNRPSHYAASKIEVIDYIEDKELGFHLGNAVKYISRAGKKGGPKDEVQDLRKAAWYLARRIRNLTK